LLQKLFWNPYCGYQDLHIKLDLDITLLQLGRFYLFMVKHNYRGTIEPWATMYKEMKKIQTENRVYC
jgi:hypothetical protein